MPPRQYHEPFKNTEQLYPKERGRCPRLIMAFCQEVTPEVAQAFAPTHYG